MSEPRAQSPEPRAQSPEPRAQRPEPRAQRPAPSAQRPAPEAGSRKPPSRSAIHFLAMATALATLMALPTAPITVSRTPLDRLDRLERALGPGSPRLFIKRDDLLGFGCGGNKVRKMQLIAA